MRTYDKRIGFLINSEHLKPTGGIGQFAKSICKLMDDHNIKVDIITDKEPHDSSINSFLTDRPIYPDKPLKYTEHQIIFAKGDSYCLEKMINFRSAIMKAMSKNLYDVFICNSHESIYVVQTLGMEENIQIIAYTHLESQIFKDTTNPFLPCVNEAMRKQLEMQGTYIGTQSTFNKLQFDNAYELPIPLPDKGLLEEHNMDREGVLFIGRWEDGKNYDLYLDLIRQTKLPARVITSETGASKFEDELKEMGADYKILYNVVGLEKVDFITKCRLAFNPSIVESYGIAFLEQMSQMPTVALENMRWTQNFNNKFFYTCNKKNMVDIVTSLYNQFDTAQKWYETGSLVNSQRMNETIFHKWNNCFNDFKAKTTTTNTAGILNHTTISYSDYIDSLNRKGQLSLSNDLRSIYNNKDKFRVIYTHTDTYFTKDPNFEPTEAEETGMSLFEGL